MNAKAYVTRCRCNGTYYDEELGAPNGPCRHWDVVIQLIREDGTLTIKAFVPVHGYGGPAMEGWFEAVSEPPETFASTLYADGSVPGFGYEGAEGMCSEWRAYLRSLYVEGYRYIRFIPKEEANDRDEYIAQLRQINLRPPGPDHPQQKFPRGARVKVTDEMPPSMKHFESGFVGIVEYSYAQKYGWMTSADHGVDQYSLLVLDLPTGKVVNSIAWYWENQLTRLDGDLADGLKIIERWENDNSRDLSPRLV